MFWAVLFGDELTSNKQVDNMAQSDDAPLYDFHKMRLHYGVNDGMVCDTVINVLSREMLWQRFWEPMMQLGGITNDNKLPLIIWCGAVYTTDGAWMKQSNRVVRGRIACPSDYFATIPEVARVL